jgi:energy-coupling factor transporter ATP-binding protein EcfA2
MAELTEEDWKSKGYEAFQLFSAGAPIDEDDLFAGRTPQIAKIIEAVFQRGQHAILYGERGVGKTSLARTFSTRLITPTKTLSAVPINCDPSDTFTTLWKKVFRDLSQDGAELVSTFPGEIYPDDVRRVLSSFDLNTTPIIVLDEFDKLIDVQAKLLIANTIKSLSDYSVPATLILVGVATSVSQLVSEHQSISRALVQVYMPRMNSLELQEIMDKRLARLGMKISKGAMAQIIGLSRGLPHYTHLIGVHSVQRAIGDRTLTIETPHVDAAEKDCLDRVDATIADHYHQATQSPRGSNIYKEVLLASALAEPDELGFFPAKAVETPLSIIMQQQYLTGMFGQHLKQLCEPVRGKILELTGTPRRFRYRFVEPLMQPYVILRGLKDGMISKDQMQQLIPSYLEPRLPL